MVNFETNTWSGLPAVFYLYMAGYIALALIAAVSVYSDAKKQRRCALGIWPIWWAGISLIGPLVGVAVYWALHHSNLRIVDQES